MDLKRDSVSNNNAQKVAETFVVQFFKENGNVLESSTCFVLKSCYFIFGKYNANLKVFQKNMHNPVPPKATFSLLLVREKVLFKIQLPGMEQLHFHKELNPKGCTTLVIRCIFVYWFILPLTFCACEFLLPV